MSRSLTGPPPGDRLSPPGMLRTLLNGHVYEAAPCETASVSGVRLSVVIPVHNGAATIGSLLDALLPQCDARCELIVIDACSTDSTAAVPEAYVDHGMSRLRTDRNCGPATPCYPGNPCDA